MVNDLWLIRSRESSKEIHLPALASQSLSDLANVDCLRTNRLSLDLYGRVPEHGNESDVSTTPGLHEP